MPVPPLFFSLAFELFCYSCKRTSQATRMAFGLSPPDSPLCLEQTERSALYLSRFCELGLTAHQRMKATRAI